MFVCVQNPTIDINSTCFQEIHKQLFDDLKQCASTMKETSLKLAELPNIYSIGFCTTKNIEYY